MDVQAIGDTDAVALLAQKLGKDAESAQLRELAAALEYMPLAMTQAAAYIKRRGPRSSVRWYLQELRDSDQSLTDLLDSDKGDRRRDRAAKFGASRRLDVTVSTRCLATSTRCTRLHDI